MARTAGRRKLLFFKGRKTGRGSKFDSRADRELSLHMLSLRILLDTQVEICECGNGEVQTDSTDCRPLADRGCLKP